MKRADALEKLEEFFSGRELSEDPIRLDVCTVIESPAEFVDAHLQMSRANIKEEISIPYLLRLIKLKKILENGKFNDSKNPIGANPHTSPA